MFLENVFVCENFLSTVKKRVIKNKQAFGGTARKVFAAFNVRDRVNLKLSLHLVHIYVCQIMSLWKKMDNKF